MQGSDNQDLPVEVTRGGFVAGIAQMAAPSQQRHGSHRGSPPVIMKNRMKINLQASTPCEGKHGMLKSISQPGEQRTMNMELQQVFEESMAGKNLQKYEGLAGKPQRSQHPFQRSPATPRMAMQILPAGQMAAQLAKCDSPFPGELTAAGINGMSSKPHREAAGRKELVMNWRKDNNISLRPNTDTADVQEEEPVTPGQQAGTHQLKAPDKFELDVSEIDGYGPGADMQGFSANMLDVSSFAEEMGQPEDSMPAYDVFRHGSGQVSEAADQGTVAGQLSGTSMSNEHGTAKRQDMATIKALLKTIEEDDTSSLLDGSNSAVQQQPCQVLSTPVRCQSTPVGLSNTTSKSADCSHSDIAAQDSWSSSSSSSRSSSPDIRKDTRRTAEREHSSQQEMRRSASKSSHKQERKLGQSEHDNSIKAERRCSCRSTRSHMKKAPRQANRETSPGQERRRYLKSKPSSIHEEEHRKPPKHRDVHSHGSRYRRSAGVSSSHARDKLDRRSHQQEDRHKGPSKHAKATLKSTQDRAAEGRRSDLHSERTTQRRRKSSPRNMQSKAAVATTKDRSKRGAISTNPKEGETQRAAAGRHQVLKRLDPAAAAKIELLTEQGLLKASDVHHYAISKLASLSMDQQLRVGTLKPRNFLLPIIIAHKVWPFVIATLLYEPTIAGPSVQVVNTLAEWRVRTKASDSNGGAVSSMLLHFVQTRGGGDVLHGTAKVSWVSIFAKYLPATFVP